MHILFIQLDLDGDGDMDVLSASVLDDKIAWYENTDGQGTFSSQKTITTQADGAFSVYAADLDGDGDMDVLSASNNDDKIAWYENTDGRGNFSTQKVISTQADSAKSVYAADLDGDGDIDVLSASQNDNKVAWYENTDGNGTFSTQKVISTQTDKLKTVYAADLDGDGDMDVLSASANDDKIAWYENTDGQGTFSAQKEITTQADWAVSVSAADVNGDGKMDVLSASGNDHKVAWYENTMPTTYAYGLGTAGNATSFKKKVTIKIHTGLVNASGLDLTRFSPKSDTHYTRQLNISFLGMNVTIWLIAGQNVTLLPRLLWVYKTDQYAYDATS